MNLMKKFSLLVAIALIITVGGVYATWSYSDLSKIDAAEANLGLKLVQYEVVGGSLMRYGTSNITAIIDDANNNHLADPLEFEGSLVMIFTSLAGANDESPDNISYEISLSLATVSGLDDWKYDDTDDSVDNAQPIFTLTAAAATPITKPLQKITSNSITTTGGVTITGQQGHYYVEVLASEMETLVELTKAFSLPTVADWNAFDTALRKGNLQLTFEPVATVAP